MCGGYVDMTAINFAGEMINLFVIARARVESLYYVYANKS